MSLRKRMLSVRPGFLLTPLVIMIGAACIAVAPPQQPPRQQHPGQQRAKKTPPKDFAVPTPCVRILLDNFDPSTAADPLTVVTAYFAPNTAMPIDSTFVTHTTDLSSTLTMVPSLPWDTDVYFTFPQRPMAQWLGPDQLPIKPCAGGTPCVHLPKPATFASFAPPYLDCYTTSLRMQPGDYPAANTENDIDVTFMSRAHALGTTAEAGAKDLYCAWGQNGFCTPAKPINPATDRSTLSKFWKAAGFTTAGAAPAGANAAAQQYMDYQDLGWGVDVRMIQDSKTKDVFSYMTLYGSARQDPASAQQAATGAAGTAKTGAVYTLAMEYSKASGKTHSWVYNGGLPTSKLQTKVNLDGLGDKFAPYACKACHGLDQKEDELYFQPYDTDGFRYPGGGTLTPAMTAQFIKLNQLVAATPQTSPNQALLTAWTTNPPNKAYAPSGWTGSTQLQLYGALVTNSCRSCHFTLSSTLDFHAYTLAPPDGNFQGWVSGMPDYVCGGGPSDYDHIRMPHSFIPFRNFWLDTVPDPLKAGAKVYRPDILVKNTSPDWPVATKPVCQ